MSPESNASPDPVPFDAGEPPTVQLSPEPVDGLPSPLPAVSAPPVKSPAELFLEQETRIEAEFKEVESAGAFYAALILPLVALIGWGYHTGSKYPGSTYYVGGIFYLT